MFRTMTACAAAAALALMAGSAQAAVTFSYADAGVQNVLFMRTPISGDPTASDDNNLEDYETRATLGDVAVGTDNALSLIVGSDTLATATAGSDSAVSFVDAANGEFTWSAWLQSENFVADVRTALDPYFFSTYSFSIDRDSVLTLDMSGVANVRLASSQGIFRDGGLGVGVSNYNLSAGAYAVSFYTSGSQPAPNTTVGSAATSASARLGFSIVESAIPEPTTWALMIMGFGAAGAMLRRRTAFA